MDSNGKAYCGFAILTEFPLCSLIRCMGDQLPFRVELWDFGWKRRLERLAATADFLTAKAAFEAAVKRQPGEPILLCDRARIVMRSGENRNE
jgi:hypothetical protein